MTIIKATITTTAAIATLAIAVAVLAAPVSPEPFRACLTAHGIEKVGNAPGTIHNACVAAAFIVNHANARHTRAETACLTEHGRGDYAYEVCFPLLSEEGQSAHN